MVVVVRLIIHYQTGKSVESHVMAGSSRQQGFDTFGAAGRLVDGALVQEMVDRLGLTAGTGAVVSDPDGMEEVLRLSETGTQPVKSNPSWIRQQGR